MSSAAPDSAITQDDHGATRGCLHPLVREFLDVRHADCMELMATFPDKHFDLAIVDPPYGLDKKLLGGETGMMKNCFKSVVSKGWDKKPSAEYFTELFRVSKNQIIWGGNYFIDHLHPTQCFISWDKMNGTNNMADFELAWASFESSCRRFSMHHFSDGYDKKIHPTQKPVALYNWLLAKYAKPGQRILDTHLGSGSHAIACHYARLHLTACEIDEDYFREACARITRETAQDTFDFPNVADKPRGPVSSD